MPSEKHTDSSAPATRAARKRRFKWDLGYLQLFGVTTLVLENDKGKTTPVRTPQQLEAFAASVGASVEDVIESSLGALIDRRVVAALPAEQRELHARVHGKTG